MTPLFLLLLLSFLPKAQSFTFCHPISTRPQTLVLFSSTEDLDSLVNDNDEEPPKKPFQTEGGVIMPEGGANPCIIKVRMFV
jgi:hypothetical protein